MPYGPYGPGPWGWGWMIGGWIMVLIAGVVILVRVLAGRNLLGSVSHDSAVEILRRRYAAGEINKEQYEELKRTLG